MHCKPDKGATMRKITRLSQQFARYVPGARRVYLMRCLILIVLMVVFDGACRKSNTAESGSPSNSSSSVSTDFWLSNAPVIKGHAVKLSDLSESEINFGIAPKRGPGVTYQDGIVLMEHGDRAIPLLHPMACPGLSMRMPRKSAIFRWARCSSPRTAVPEKFLPCSITVTRSQPYSAPCN